MRNFSFAGGADSLAPLIEALKTDGEVVAPRGQMTYELRNVTIEITDPSDVCFDGMGRNWNAGIAVAESLQLIGGFSDPEMMVKISPAFQKFRDPDGSFHGAYGPRIAYQIPRVIRRLTDDPYSRQAIVQIWDAKLDLAQSHPDLPCTIGFNFAIRDGKLLMSTHMRSNDVWWGWCYDLMQFTQLGWCIARQLGTELHSYTHYVDSFHIYQRDIAAAREIAPPPLRVNRRVLTGLHADRGNTWMDVIGDARSFFNGHTSLTPLTPFEKFAAETMEKYR